VDVATDSQRSFRPFGKTRVEVIAISRQAKDGTRVGLNNRDARWLRWRGERPRG
jgi:hypothetical protein